MKRKSSRRCKITADVALAAGRDAGNRSMKKAGRLRWNEVDYAEAANVCLALLGHTYIDSKYKLARRRRMKITGGKA